MILGVSIRLRHGVGTPNFGTAEGRESGISGNGDKRFHFLLVDTFATGILESGVSAFYDLRQFSEGG